VEKWPTGGKPPASAKLPPGAPLLRKHSAWALLQSDTDTGDADTGGADSESLSGALELLGSLRISWVPAGKPSAGTQKSENDDEKKDDDAPWGLELDLASLAEPHTQAMRVLLADVASSRRKRRVRKHRAWNGHLLLLPSLWRSVGVSAPRGRVDVSHTPAGDNEARGGDGGDGDKNVSFGGNEELDDANAEALLDQLASSAARRASAQA